MEKVAVVTGGARGIGAAVCRRLAADGYRVAVNYCTSRGQAEALAAEIRGMAVCADVSQEDEVARLFDAVRAGFGEPELLVCNAGIAADGLITEMTLAEWRALFAVNMDAAFLCCRAALPAMIRAQHGCIVTVSSMWGQVGASCEVAYSATKAALIGFTKALAKEVAPSDVRVNCVAPGCVATDMMRGYSAADIRALEAETPLGRLGQVGEIADAVAFLASDAAAFITGQVLGVNGGFVI